MMKHIWKFIPLLLLLFSGCQRFQDSEKMECNKHQDIVITAQTPRSADIYVINSNGSGLEKLTEPINSYVHYSSALWSPDGCQIVFKSDLDRGHEEVWGWVPMDIFVMNFDGTEKRNLTKNKAHNDQISWSPDGMKILFRSDKDGDFDIYVIDPDGTSLQQLTKNDWSDSYPQWSPNGQQILFLAGQNNDDDSEIFMINADGTGLRQLTDNRYNEGEFKWSPDGKQIAYISSMRHGKELYIMNADGSNSYRVTYDQVQDNLIDWSKDGSLLFYVSDLEGSETNFYEYSLPKSVASLVTDLKIYESSVVISQRENKALVGTDGNKKIFLIELDGSSIEQIDIHVEKINGFDWR